MFYITYITTIKKGANKIIITLYTKERCAQCTATKRHLKKLNLRWVEKNLSENPELVREVKLLGYLQAPVITVSTSNGQTRHWSGYRPDLIDEINP